MVETREIKNNILFSEFFNSYVTCAKNNLIMRLEVKDKNISAIKINSCVLLFNDILKKLFKLGIRALISELHNYKKQGKLSGNSTYERYNYFEKLTAQSEFKDYFFKKYPVLDMMMKSYLDETVNYIVEIVENFIKDQSLLETKFHVKLDCITDISIGLGDTHNSGKTVAIVYFETFRLVYKPHSLTGDYIFEQILQWINCNANIRLDLKNVKALSLNTRGWEEYIEQRSCNSIEDIRRYYYRMGCYLAVFYSLGTTDLHFENVIASKDYPMFIDLETLFGNSKIDKFSTVLDTGLLPQIRTDSLIDVDTSGICGKSNKSNSMKSLTIIYPKTDEMAVEEVPAIVTNRKNVVIFKNKIVEIEDFVDDLINGYDMTINFLINNKENFINTILFDMQENSKFRIVLRHTQVYSKYLSAALHPDYLSDVEKRKELFQRLQINCKEEFENKRVLEEVHELLYGSVPYFMFDFYTRNLYSYSGVVKQDYFQYSGSDFLLKRINSLDKYKTANRELIKKSLQTSYLRKDNQAGRKFSNPNVTQVKLLFLKYINYIIDGIFDANDGSAMYFFNRLADNAISLEIINVDLYEGGGIILCLALAGRVYKNDDYFKYAKKLLKTATEILKYKHRMKNTVALSAFSGYGSLLYLCYLLHNITGDDYYKKEAEITTDFILHNDYLNEQSICTYDYLDGLAGVIVFTSNLLITKKNVNVKIRKLFDKTVDLLNNFIKNNNICNVGLAHGLSGYAYAYIMVYKVTHKDKYLLKAKELLLFEDQLYKSNKTQKASWCKGETGLCISRIKYLELSPNIKIRDSFEHYYKILCTKGINDVENMCLCHGLYGNIEIIREINKILKNQNIINEQLILPKLPVLKKIEDIYLGYNKKFYTDTFMTGLSGILYSLLREEIDLPSILLLGV